MTTLSFQLSSCESKYLSNLSDQGNVRKIPSTTQSEIKSAISNTVSLHNSKMLRLHNKSPLSMALPLSVYSVSLSRKTHNATTMPTVNKKLSGSPSSKPFLKRTNTNVSCIGGVNLTSLPSSSVSVTPSSGSAHFTRRVSLGTSTSTTCPSVTVSSTSADFAKKLSVNSLASMTPSGSSGDAHKKVSFNSNVPMTSSGSSDDFLKKIRLRRNGVQTSNSLEKKPVKVFLSQRQSSSLKELGKSVPCAPPATPTPEHLQQYEYISSLTDIKSQRQMRSRLECFSRSNQKKEEKKKKKEEEAEKLTVKEKLADHRKRQRQEIYALNKVMTELETKHYEDLLKTKGLNIRNTV